MKRRPRIEFTLFDLLYGLMLTGLFVSTFVHDNRTERLAMLVLVVVLYSGQQLGDKLSRCAAALERLADDNERATREQGMRAARETWGKHER